MERNKKTKQAIMKNCSTILKIALSKKDKDKLLSPPVFSVDITDRCTQQTIYIVIKGL